jgi:hypothetical protein
VSQAPTDMRKLKALSEEVDAAAALLNHGFRILTGYRFAVHDADPLFVCLAGGVEKLLKLTLGLHGLEINNRWPSAREMQAVGHAITELEERVRLVIRDRISLSTAPGYIRMLLDDVTADRYIDFALKTLERYAVRGRFYNLDYLGDRPQPEASPRELWEELHQELLAARPELLAKIASPTEWEEGRREINALIGDSMRLWCELIARSWMTGVVGQQAKICAPGGSRPANSATHPA